MEAQIETRKLTAAPRTRRLYEAVVKGDIASFEELKRQDRLIIDRCVIENASSCCFQPLLLLHVAAEKGHLEMVKTLLELRPSICLAHDGDGRNPIHVAAIQGHLKVLEVLHEANPHAAQERTSSGDTILHLCIKHNQLQALKTLLKLTDGDGGQLLNSKDSNGNTVLHLAMTSKQHETVDYLLRHPTRMEKNAVNKNNMTVVDIYVKQRKSLGKEEEIEQSLKDAKAKPAKDVLKKEADGTWLEEQCTSLMVVASLIAAAAFHVGINPPRGVWQEDIKQKQEAGVSVWSSRSQNGPFKGYYHGYHAIIICNSLALISSLSVILLLISGLPCKRHFLISILRIILWITVSATTLTDLFSINLLTTDDISTFEISNCSIISWLGLVGFIFLGNVVRFIWKLLGWPRKESIRRLGNKWFSRLFCNITTTTNDCCC